jgi:hypothetical protein
MQGLTGYVDKHFVLHNPENPLIGVIGVQTMFQSKRSELRLFGAGIASRYFGHIYPRKNKSYNKIAPLKGNIEKRLNQDYQSAYPLATPHLPLAYSTINNRRSL